MESSDGAREGFPFAAAGRSGAQARPAEESGKVWDWTSFGGALGGSGGRALTVTIDRRKRQKQLTGRRWHYDGGDADQN